MIGITRNSPDEVDAFSDLSEGEGFIEEFFLDEGIKYRSQVEVKNLKSDTKAYRVADFYLPKFGLYVEFFGRWNVNKEERIRYREKKRVYSENNIPCIYLYPENLGILKYVFNYRVRELLHNRGMKKQLFSFHRFQFGQSNWQFLMIICLGSTYLLNEFFEGTRVALSFKATFVIGLGFAIILSLINLIQNFYFYFIEDRFHKIIKQSPSGR